MDRSAMTSLQSAKLHKLIRRLCDKSPFYQEKLAELALGPDCFTGISDLAKLPFTTRSDLVNHYPYGLLTFPLSSVARIHITGRGAQPVAVAYTSGDIAKWLEMLARTLVAGGLNPGGVIQIIADYGLQPEGLGLHYAAEITGATVLPAALLPPETQLATLAQFGVTALAAAPEYLLALAEAARALAIDLQALPVSTVYIISSRPDNKLSAEIAGCFNAAAVDVYTVNELIGPGVAGGCPANCGLHIQEDYFYPEIINPLNGEVKAEGETGELVLTSLGKEAMPVLRYRTGRQAVLNRAPCACGRTLARLLF
ncbi:phenylacetate--CoA ligase family protein [Dendrosporobacter quercicolus]|nr:phenylacetate--CoA ligase [Dendrosporobacter quercicolus]